MLALIPARAGSKGLPGKNIKLLNGKPLIAYTIEAALKAKFIERVIVSTDDEEIAQIAKAYGAEVPFLRPEHLATDQAKSIDVYQYTIGRLQREENSVIKEIIVLQPTSPLRTSYHIDEAICLFKQKDADSVVSYCEEQHPIFWHKYLNDTGQFEEIFNGDFLKNRQEIRKTYYPNGAIYILKRELILCGGFYTDKSFAYIMGRRESIDIDTVDDFRYAQYLLNRNNN